MASAYSLQSRSVTTTYYLIGIFAVITAGFFYALSLYFGNSGYSLVFALIGLTIGVGQPLIGYFYGENIALAAAGGKEVAYEQAPQLHEMVENLSRIAGIPKPRIFISPDPSANAFACGRGPGHASICFNQGILDILNKSELEGVVGHELAHIKNRDVLVMTMAAILASVIGFLADIAARAALFGGGSNNNESKNPYTLIIFVVAIFLTPILALLLQMSISRSREYLADSTSVTFTRYPEGLKSALMKLESSPVASTTARSFTNHMYITTPKKSFGEKAKNLFSTHPSIESRIANLDEMNGTAS